MAELVKSATDLIIQAMENADEMEEVCVVYRLKGHDSGDADGFGWLSNTEDTHVRVGMMASASWGMLQKAYSKEDMSD